MRPIQLRQLLAAGLLLVAAFGLPASASAFPLAKSAQSEMHFPDCGDVYGVVNEQSVRPGSVSNGCIEHLYGGDGASAQMTWVGWGSDTAIGTGTVILPTCGNPDEDLASTCPGSTFEAPVTVTLSGAKRCFSAGGDRAYYASARATSRIPVEHELAWGTKEYTETWNLTGCVKPSYLVSVRPDGAVKFGPASTMMGVSGRGDEDISEADALDLIFGAPTSRKSKRDCATSQWKPIGVTVRDSPWCARQLVRMTEVEDGRRKLIWSVGWGTKVALSGSAWRTPNGIHPGSTERAAKKSAKAVCTKSLCGRIKGYVLVLRRQGCGAGDGWATYWQEPTLIAEVKRGKVARLLVQQRASC